MLLPLAAANIWPPLLKEHSVQPLTGNSLISLRPQQCESGLQKACKLLTDVEVANWMNARSQNQDNTKVDLVSMGSLEVVHQDGEEAQLVRKPHQHRIAVRVQRQTQGHFHEQLHQLQRPGRKAQRHDSAHDTISQDCTPGTLVCKRCRA